LYSRFSAPPGKVFFAERLRPARGPPVQSVLLTQEASLSHPTGLARPRLSIPRSIGSLSSIYIEAGNGSPAYNTFKTRIDANIEVARKQHIH
jgi:hypothetical protein